jgi:hypothetical protein
MSGGFPESPGSHVAVRISNVAQGDAIVTVSPSAQPGSDSTPTAKEKAPQPALFFREFVLLQSNPAQAILANDAVEPRDVQLLCSLSSGASLLGRAPVDVLCHAARVGDSFDLHVLAHVVALRVDGNDLECIVAAIQGNGAAPSEVCV